MNGSNYENTYSKSITVNMLPCDFKELEATAKKRGTSKMQIVREALHYYLRQSKENKGR